VTCWQKFANETIDIACNCGKVTPKSIGWLKENNQFVCDLECDNYQFRQYRGQ
jgi:hypothetical protein